MPPALLPADKPHRLAALHASGTVDSQPDESFDTLAQCAAQLTDCPIAVISLIDAEREWLKAVHGWDKLPVRQIPHAVSLSSHTLAGSALFEVPDTTHDPRFAHNPFVTGAPHMRAYAGEPLCVNGVNVGVLYVLHTQPHTLTSTQRDSLRRLARMASELLASRHQPPADEERTRLLDFARASGDWMWETDDQMRYTWVSSTFEAVTGLSPASMRGEPMDDSPLLDSLGEPLENGLSLHTLLTRRQAITRVISNKATPRGLLQVSRSAVPVFDPHGRFSGYRGTARDMSAHIAATRSTHGQAELLRKLSSQVPGVIFQLWLQADGEVTYTYASEASRDLLGAEPPRNNGGDTQVICRLLHPDDLPDFMPSLVAASRALVPWQREFRIIRDAQCAGSKPAPCRAHPRAARCGTGFLPT